MSTRDRFESLQSFVEVARAGSLAAAARSLRRAPSSVSRELAMLEKRLGAQLVLRTTCRLRLTDAGQRYLLPRTLVDGNLDRLVDGHQRG